MDKSYRTNLQRELEILIAFRPVTGDTVATKKLLQYIEKRLKDLGMLTRLVEKAGFSTLIAGTRSLKRSKVLLQAHVDVLPGEEELFKPKLKKEVLYGRGTYDMLFGVASFLVILDTLHAQGSLDTLDIGVMLTSDEEVGGHNGVGYFIKSYDCEVCILPDAGSADQLNQAGKGVLQLEVIALGTSGHAAQPQAYDNPIYKTVDIIKEISKKFPNNNPAFTTCSITKIEGGEALNQTPGSVSLALDIRYVFDDNPDDIEAEIEELVRQYGASVKQLVCEPAYKIDMTHNKVKNFIKLYESMTGRGIKLGQWPGSSDARFMTPKHIPVIMMRPSGGGLHGPNEHVDLASLVEFTEVLEDYIRQNGAH